MKHARNITLCDTTLSHLHIHSDISQVYFVFLMSCFARAFIFFVPTVMLTRRHVLTAAIFQVRSMRCGENSSHEDFIVACSVGSPFLHTSNLCLVILTRFPVSIIPFPSEHHPSSLNYNTLSTIPVNLSTSPGLTINPIDQSIHQSICSHLDSF